MTIYTGLADLTDFPLILLYVVAAAIVVIASLKLSDFLNIIDKKSNISGAFLGGVLLAMVTSLPELFSSLTATVFVKNNDYVLGNVLGSNLFNIMIFALIFFFFFKKMVEKKVSKYFLVSMAFCGALYVLTAVAGLLFVPLKWLFGYFNPVSLLIIAVYVISIIKTPKIEDINTYQDTVKVTKQKINQKNEKVDVEFTNDGPRKLAARRTMMAYLPDLQEQKAAKESKESFRNRTADINHPLIEKLFGEYAPKYAKRAEELHTAGGYTSIIRTTERHGDNAQLCVLKLVD